jgi:hypothetical protein
MNTFKYYDAVYRRTAEVGIQVYARMHKAKRRNSI